ncbi:hypothetical protein pdam_00018011, partial [Pocillopora damicornis]
MKTSISLTLNWRKLLTTNAIEKSLLNKRKNKLEEGQRFMLECQKDILLAGKSQCGWYMVEEYPHPRGLHLHMRLLPFSWPACSKTSSHPPPYTPEVYDSRLGGGSDPVFTKINSLIVHSDLLNSSFVMNKERSQWNKFDL